MPDAKVLNLIQRYEAIKDKHQQSVEKIMIFSENKIFGNLWPTNSFRGTSDYPRLLTIDKTTLIQQKNDKTFIVIMFINYLIRRSLFM